MATQNAANQSFSNAADGFSLGGGTTQRTLTVTGSNITLTGTGSNTHTFPASSDTLVGRTSSDTLTNKTIDAGSNTITNLGNTNISAAAAIALSKLATGYVSANVNGTATTTTIWRGTQAQYDAIGTKDSNTLYFISG